jgi:hypothetical protein
MSYAFDYEEPAPKMIKRLGSEHDLLESELEEVERLCKEGKVRIAISLLNAIQVPILRHAVEEEAKLMRLIMKETPSESQKSVEVMRRHRKISDFLRLDLPRLTGMKEKEAKRSIMEFVKLFREQRMEEEAVVFPQTLKAHKKASRQKQNT